MTQYACSSVTAFVPVGGVCQGHSKGPQDTNLTVDCLVCEPILIGDPFWAGSPEEVPLTAAEEKRLARQEREIQLQRAADAVADREFLSLQRAGRAQ